MTDENFVVMDDECYGNDCYITTLDEFRQECELLGFDYDAANLPDLDEFLMKNPAWKMSDGLKRQFVDDAHRLGIVEKINEWLIAE